PDLLTDPRFSDPSKQAENGEQLRQILDEAFAKQPLSYWRGVFDKAHITFGAIVDPAEAINDPQLRENDIVVPLEGAGGNLKLTVSSPMQVHGIAKVPAKRAPELGEHNEQILQELGFNTTEIGTLREKGTVPSSNEHKSAA